MKACDAERFLGPARFAVSWHSARGFCESIRASDACRRRGCSRCRSGRALGPRRVPPSPCSGTPRHDVLRSTRLGVPSRHEGPLGRLRPGAGPARGASDGRTGESEGRTPRQKAARSAIPWDAHNAMLRIGKSEDHRTRAGSSRRRWVYGTRGFLRGGCQPRPSTRGSHSLPAAVKAVELRPARVARGRNPCRTVVAGKFNCRQRRLDATIQWRRAWPRYWIFEKRHLETVLSCANLAARRHRLERRWTRTRDRPGG